MRAVVVYESMFGSTRKIAEAIADGLSPSGTRKGAQNCVRKPGSDLTLELGADTAPGVREWLASLGRVSVRAAAFDTRIKGPAAHTGRASRAIDQRLSRHRFVVVMPPESFLGDRKSHLIPGETERARDWGARLATIARQEPART